MNITQAERDNTTADNATHNLPRYPPERNASRHRASSDGAERRVTCVLTSATRPAHRDTPRAAGGAEPQSERRDAHRCCGLMFPDTRRVQILRIQSVQTVRFCWSARVTEPSSHHHYWRKHQYEEKISSDTQS
ncbi:unnamed protein product [Leuciscus chuanchicus]